MLSGVLVPRLLVVLAACALAPASEFKVSGDEMKEIGVAYKKYCDAAGQPPAKAEQLSPYLDNNKRLVDALKDKDIVFFYNVPMNKVGLPAGASHTVLAYEKKTPTKGGWVVVFDGTVSQLSVEEFKNMKLPKK
jgi:hypothetical protein